MEKRIITLTTDFGAKDPFVGIMKGVIWGINPHAVTVDLCHEIEQGNILRASGILNSSMDYFPSGSLHVIVVDPGVGSHRRKILVKSENRFFIGPDNGVLTAPLKSKGFDFVLEILNSEYFLHPVSNTFHGRDIFAPVAAHLSLGKDPNSFGKLINDPGLLKLSEPEPLPGGEMKGEVTHKDRFGNMSTNLNLPPGEKVEEWQLHVKGFKEIPLRTHYAESKEDELSALINSEGVVELFVKNGDASERFGLEEGSEVFIERKEIEK